MANYVEWQQTCFKTVTLSPPHGKMCRLQNIYLFICCQEWGHMFCLQCWEYGSGYADTRAQLQPLVTSSDLFVPPTPIKVAIPDVRI